MSVCAAAIAEQKFLIGASDRMITAGNIEFEPQQSKLWLITPAIIVMVAGDLSRQAEILKKVVKEVQGWVNSDPSTWVNVKDVVNLYCNIYREMRRAEAEAQILYPLGLDLQSFLANQAAMQNDLVSKIVDQLANFDFPEVVEAIFMGKDHDGPVNDEGQKLIYCQLYTTERDKMSCFTTVGFAAVGIGKSHAESQFMFSGHVSRRSFDETILLAYAAKKRAEVAPGVGKETDIIVMGPELAQLIKIDDNHVQTLDGIYQKSRRAAERTVKRAQLETKKFVDQVRHEYEERLINQNTTTKKPEDTQK